MHATKYVTHATDGSLDQPSTQATRRASNEAEAASVEQAKRREETRKYVERVNRYLARDETPQPKPSLTTN